MKTINNKHNSLLLRKEVVVEMSYPSNPGFSKVKEDLSANLKVAPEQVVIRKVDSSFGSSSFRVMAMVYDSIEQLTLVEAKPKKKKGAN